MVLGKASDGSHIGEGHPSQPGKDLCDEQRRIWSWSGPRFDGALVRGVLGAAKLGCSSAVSRVASFSA